MYTFSAVPSKSKQSVDKPLYEEICMKEETCTIVIQYKVMKTIIKKTNLLSNSHGHFAMNWGQGELHIQSGQASTFQNLGGLGQDIAT